ncbi:small integral membrane protein 4 [Halyomorpha halys]|uniref:small integral membrane protein 4 n=1 Tax=Halyomorpha halys TaxID=286706 RepID=UPI0006D5157C|nr:small integral membrane protein 4 [Halyomorpha halys]
MRRNESLKKFLDYWPGKRIFGIFRFLPIFFCLGAALEYSMINWDFRGQVNFYRTYKKRQIQDKLEQLVHEEKAPVS